MTDGLFVRGCLSTVCLSQSFVSEISDAARFVEAILESGQSSLPRHYVICSGRVEFDLKFKSMA